MSFGALTAVRLQPHLFPALHRARGRREVHTDAGHRAVAGDVRTGIAALLYLPERLFRTLVQLELEDVDVLLHLKDAVHAPAALCVLATDGAAVHAYQAEKQVEGVLEVLLGLLHIVQRRVRIVWDAREEGGERVAESLGMPFVQQQDGIQYPAAHLSRGRFQVVGGQQGEESLAHLVVGEVQQETARTAVVLLDGEVPALVNHGQGTLHVGLVVHKHGGVVEASGQLVDVLVAAGKQADEVGGRAGGEPVVAELLHVEGVEDAEGVVDVGHGRAEVIAVVLPLQEVPHLVKAASVLPGQGGDRFCEVLAHLLPGNAAESLVAVVHADVLGLVEAAEHADLRELGDARQQHELQVAVGRLEGGVERLQDVAVAVLQKNLFAFAVAGVITGVEHVEDGLVVLVHQHHGTTAGTLAGTLQNALEAVADGRFMFPFPVFGFPLAQIVFDGVLQFSILCIVSSVEVDVEDGIFVPRLRK